MHASFVTKRGNYRNHRKSPGFNYGECQSTLLGASLFTLLLLLAIAIVTLVGKWKVYTEDDSDTNYEVL